MNDLLIAIAMLCNFQNDEVKSACNNVVLKCARDRLSVGFNNAIDCYFKFSMPQEPRKK